MNLLALSALHPVSLAVAESGAHGVPCPRCGAKALLTEPAVNVFSLRAFHLAGCALAVELHESLTPTPRSNHV